MLNAMIEQQWGSYRLIRLLGRGTFADVYLGKHVRLDMQAAIKILRTSLHDQAIESFQQEAEVIAALLHPHIVRLLDFDIQDGQPFLVLEYAPSGSLNQRYPRGTKLPLALVADYISQAASALQYAHEKKLVHRDVKPANMLIGRQGALLLSDFGIATIAHSTSSMAMENIQGTPIYMAPEQIQGHPRAASDQYALGIAAYQWLTGSTPFQGSSNEVITQHLAITPRPLYEYEPQIPEEVEQVMQTALAKEPRARFSSVIAFADALQQAARMAVRAPQAAPVVNAASAPAVQDAPFASDTPTLPGSPLLELAEESEDAPTILAQETTPTRALLATSVSAQATKRLVTEPLETGVKPASRVRARAVLLILFTAILALLIIGGATLLAGPASLNKLRGITADFGPDGLAPTVTATTGHATPVVGTNQSTPTVTSTGTPAAAPTATPTPGSSTSSSSPSTSSSSSTPASRPTSPPVPAPQPTSPPAPTPRPTSPPVANCLRAGPASITVTQVLGTSASLPGSAITLTNCSSVSGHWTASVQYNSGSGWASCNPSGGTISANSAQTIHLVTGSPKVLLGTYSATWIFSMGNTSATVHVTLLVVA